ncbi:hypothetical protein ACFFX0_11340 [Citricoccus parietis]|uniref:Uncharacterized protein n=1 Tax=Citricoccus parietis TaxID=592307 RepID=A0ABV5FYJ7_9MICC
MVFDPRRRHWQHCRHCPPFPGRTRTHERHRLIPLPARLPTRRPCSHGFDSAAHSPGRPHPAVAVRRDPAGRRRAGGAGRCRGLAAALSRRLHGRLARHLGRQPGHGAGCHGDRRHRGGHRRPRRWRTDRHHRDPRDPRGGRDRRRLRPGRPLGHELDGHRQLGRRRGHRQRHRGIRAELRRGHHRPAAAHGIQRRRGHPGGREPELLHGRPRGPERRGRLPGRGQFLRQRQLPLRRDRRRRPPPGGGRPR